MLRPRHLSGGQRQRAVIARALTVGADFLVLDEPTSFLDVSEQARVLQLLTDLQQQLHLTYLFISHNLDVVAYMSHRIGVMYQGRLVEVAPASTLLSRPLHPYAKALANAVLPPDPEVARQKQVPRLSARSRAGGCRYYPVCPQGQVRCTLADPELLEVQARHAVACYLAEGYEEVMSHGSQSGGGVAAAHPPGPRLHAADA
jgi:oligopeptide/dipeptide ABC transporter ATP-binding protein